jgi:beta-phosphoglucomutase-like phosphatase (HAD superfamily)
LKTAGLLHYFVDEHIFSSKMVANGKPAPDLFLHAAKAFNYLPKDCLVIEDSHFGIQAANAAGMSSIAFFGGQHAQDDWYKTRVLEQNPTNACDTMIDVVGKLQALL